MYIYINILQILSGFQTELSIPWRSIVWRDDIDTGLPENTHHSNLIIMLYNMLNVIKLYTYMNVVVIVCL